MSGIIRRNLGRYKKTLIDQIDSITKGIPFTSIQKSNLGTEEHETLLRFRNFIETFLERTTAPLKCLKDTSDRWDTFMSSLPASERKLESEIFENYMTQYGDYFEAITSGNNLILQLREWQRSVEYELHIRFPDESELNEAIHIPPQDDNSRAAATTAAPNDNLNMGHMLHSLPKIHIPIFSGEYSKWLPFWECFNALVHSKPMDNFYKFSQLLHFVKDEPHALIAGLPCDNSNYQIAIDILTRTYGKPSIIKEQLQNKLMNVTINPQTLSNEWSAATEMLNLFRQIKQLDPQIDQSLTLTLLKCKFSVATRKAIKSKLGDKVDDSVTTYLETAIDYLTEERQYFSPQQEHTHFTKDKLTCLFCEKSHPGDCRTFRNFTDRLNRLRELNKCTRCTLPYSKNHSCSISCHYCKLKGHHSSVCRKRLSQSSHSPSRFQSNNHFRSSRSHSRERFRSNSQYQPNSPSRRNHYSNNRSRDDRSNNFPPRKFNKQDNIPRRDSTPDSRSRVHFQHPSKPKSNEHTHLTNESNSFPSIESEQVLLSCVPIKIKHPISSDIIHTHALIDHGSTRSYILKDFALTHALPHRGLESITINGFGENSQNLHTSKVAVNIFTATGLHALNLTVVPTITRKLLCADLSAFTNESDLRDTKSMPTTNVVPSILLGADYLYDLLEPKESIWMSSGFYKVDTLIGPIVSGRGIISTSHCHNEHANVLFTFNITDTILPDSIPNSPSNTEENSKSDNHFLHYITLHNNSESLDALLEKLWKLDSTGICDDPAQDDDKKCLDFFLNSITRNGQRYQVKWPWRSPSPNIGTNYGVAISRLRGTHSKILKDGGPQLLQKYDAIFREQLDLDIIEEVNPNQVDGQFVHYLPHHGVIKLNSTTPIRIVFDASSKQKGFDSLNESLFRGPVLMPLLCSILLRIRTYSTMIIADIQKAFLQLELDLPDREVTRFLWMRNPEEGPTNQNLVIYRFKRVPFGVISSPFLLNGTIQYHLSNTSTTLGQEILRNLYVDNVILHGNSLSECKDKYSTSKSIFSEAEMNLRDYISNDSDFNNFLISIGEKPQETIKLLGLIWNITDDTISVKIPSLPTDHSYTKRSILRFVASVYDPAGFISPLLVHLKLFIQKLWATKLDWDTQLDESLVTEWKEKTSEWSLSEELFTLPRFISSPHMNFELHVFADASGHAFGCVAYLVSISETDIQSHILFSKSRIAPIKKMTIPKLELTALECATSTTTFIHK